MHIPHNALTGTCVLCVHTHEHTCAHKQTPCLLHIPVILTLHVHVSVICTNFPYTHILHAHMLHKHIHHTEAGVLLSHSIAHMCGQSEHAQVPSTLCQGFSNCRGVGGPPGWGFQGTSECAEGLRPTLLKCHQACPSQLFAFFPSPVHWRQRPSWREWAPGVGTASRAPAAAASLTGLSLALQPTW